VDGACFVLVLPRVVWVCEKFSCAVWGSVLFAFWVVFWFLFVGWVLFELVLWCVSTWFVVRFNMV
jgi:hypothetical protein